MGNRAIITDTTRKVGVYLHWNGGRDSVEPFLEYCKRKKYRGFGSDTSYGMARLIQVIGNFFGGTTSLGVTTCCKGYEDNGLYVVKDWDIVGRYIEQFDEETQSYKEVEFPEDEEQNEWDFQEMLESIDLSQPEKERLGIDFLRAKKVPVSSLKVGDTIFTYNWNDELKKVKVIGFGENEPVNGHNVLGLPQIDLCNGGDWTNPNNYIYEKEVYKA